MSLNDVAELDVLWMVYQQVCYLTDRQHRVGVDAACGPEFIARGIENREKVRYNTRKVSAALQQLVQTKLLKLETGRFEVKMRDREPRIEVRRWTASMVLRAKHPAMLADMMLKAQQQEQLRQEDKQDDQHTLFD
jgi:hypothetical protein